jgi:hypothetical protein
MYLPTFSNSALLHKEDAIEIIQQHTGIKFDIITPSQ